MIDQIRDNLIQVSFGGGRLGSVSRRAAFLQCRELRVESGKDRLTICGFASPERCEATVNLPPEVLSAECHHVVFLDKESQRLTNDLTGGSIAVFLDFLPDKSLQLWCQMDSHNGNYIKNKRHGLFRIPGFFVGVHAEQREIAEVVLLAE